MIWILLAAYIIPMIICILCIKCNYKNYCNKYSYIATVQGLCNYMFNIIIVSFIPGINIIAGLVFLISMIWDRIKYIKI